MDENEIESLFKRHKIRYNYFIDNYALKKASVGRIERNV